MNNWFIIVLTSGVISAIVSVILDNLYKKKHRKDFDFFEKKEKLYNNILSYMEMFIIPESKCNMHIDGYTNNDLINMSVEEFKELAKISLLGFLRRGSLYYSENVLMALVNFNSKACIENYLKVIIAMRSDLWSMDRIKKSDTVFEMLEKLGEIK